MDAPSGCAFHPRCPYVLPECRSEIPPLVAVDGGVARCFRAKEGAARLSASSQVGSQANVALAVSEEGKECT
jgi:peptide/nickel transport system ATP-binding protein